MVHKKRVHTEEQEKETVKLKLRGEIPTLYNFKHLFQIPLLSFLLPHTGTQKGIG